MDFHFRLMTFEHITSPISSFRPHHEKSDTSLSPRMMDDVAEKPAPPAIPVGLPRDVRADSARIFRALKLEPIKVEFSRLLGAI